MDLAQIISIASIPSPSNGIWHLGPFPLRAYAMALLSAIIVSSWWAGRRWVQKGGQEGQIFDLSLWAVPAGIIGARIYHVISSPNHFFGEGGDPMAAFRIWEGGLGIWGAIGGGLFGAWLGARQMGMSFPAVCDTAGPVLLLAQVIGRLGNWFNQELFGGPTDLPWALEVSDRTAMRAGYEPGTTFHPTFLYEMLWNLPCIVILLWLEKRYRLAHGQVFWAYVMLYTSGRLWIEMMRIDTANLILGVRVNVWVSIGVFLIALVSFAISRRRHNPDNDVPPNAAPGTIQLATPQSTPSTEPTATA